MPNITEFDAGPLAIRPTETGVEAFAAAGRRIGAFYSQQAAGFEQAGQRLSQGIRSAGDAALAYVDHQQIATGAAHGATLFASQLEEKDKAIKAIDPNDPAYGPKVEAAVKQWREEQLEPALQDFQKEFTTQRSQDWALHFVDSTRQTMFVHSTSDIAQAAHVGVLNSTRTLVNTATTTVFNNPGLLGSQFDLVDHGIKGSVETSPLKGVDAAKVLSEVSEKAKEQLVKSAVQGAITKGGNWQAIASDPKYAPYINAAETKQFEQAQRTYQRMEVAEARQARVMKDYENKQNFNEAADKLELSTLPKNVGDSVTLPPTYWEDVKKIGQQPGVDPGRLRSLIDTGEKVTERMNAPKIVNNQAVSDALFARAVSDPNFSKRDIAPHLMQLDDAHARRLVETVDMMKANKLKDNPQFQYAQDWAKQRIEMNYGGPKFAGGAFPAFMSKFLEDYNNAKPDVQANALNINDENSLIRKNMDSYKPPLADAIAANGGGPPPVPTYMPTTGGAQAAPVTPAKPAVPAVPVVPAARTFKKITKEQYDALEPGPFISEGSPYTKPATPTLAPGQM